MPSSAGDDAPAASAAASAKGKATMEADDEAAKEGVACGICLTDSRRAIRGELDCCAHHFCFVCIMAWARVESRCPFCKARFQSIRRPPVPGRLPHERVVAVAQRVQVWHPLGNESNLVGTDPSANSGCSVCSCTNDEDLLLLCELCDVAAHTYCAGLGTTVPEGDWFCKDCATSKEEHSRCQVDDGSGSSDQGELENTIEVPSCAEPVTDRSRSGIVDEGYSRSSLRPTDARSRGPIPVASTYGNTDEYYGTNHVRGTNARSSRPIPVPSTDGNTDEYYRTNLVRETNAWSSGPFQVPSIYDDVDEDYGTDPADVANVQSSGPVPSIYDIVDEDYETRPLHRARPDRNSDDFPSRGSSSDESLYLGSPKKRKSGSAFFRAHARFGNERARTLRNSRNLSNRIMELRQNWPALHAGSVGFTAHLQNNRRENSVATSSVNEHQQSMMPSTKETATISGRANKDSPKDTRHVNKAWKMLEMAKSAGGRKKCNKPSSLDCTPRFSMGNRSTSISPIDTILGQKNQSLSTLVAQRNTVKYDSGAKKDNTLPKKDNERHRNFNGNCHALVLERTGSFQDRMINQESPNGKVASSSHSQHVGQKQESSRGSKVASSSRRQHTDPTLESLCDSHGSGKPKMEVLHPFSNSLSSGLSTVSSQLHFLSSTGSQSGAMINPEEPSAVKDTTSSEIGTVTATVEVRKTSAPDRHGSKRKLRSETSDDQASKESRKSCKITKREISSGTMENPEGPSAVRVATSSEIGTAAAAVETRDNSGSDRHGLERKHRFETSDDQGSKRLRKSCKIAKSEISSLAMRELKLLKIDKTYGSDRFKEVARAATHTVLASCGLDHSPELALALPRPVCKHSSRTEPPKPSAIANTCKECLCDFVKEAISSVLSCKQTDQAAASC